MTLSDLISEFNVVVDTPEGLKELRSLILGLAVRGKLVEQDPNDEPASELLKKIEAEKERLYEEGEIRKPKKLNNVSNEEEPFAIPENWIWTKLGKTANDVHYGYTESADFDISEPKFLRITDIQDGKVDWDNTPGCAIKEDEISKYQLHNGDVLIARTGGTVGKSFLINDVEYSAVFASYLIRFIPIFTDTSEYIYTYLYTKLYWDQLYESTSGTGQPNVNATKLSDLLFPLPPLAEQHRIVQKIEALFAEVDELEAKLNQQNKLDEKLQKAVNSEVQKAPDAEASKSAWNFITSNFKTLYHTPEAIDNLKKNILNEAVRGRLVPQDPNDEPASELLKKIETEKQRLYEEGEIRKPKKLPPIKEDEIPFEIPESWEWVQTNTIYETVRGGSPRPAGDPKFYDGKIPFLKVGDLTNDEEVYVQDYSTTIKEAGLRKTRQVGEGIVLLTNSGATLGVPKVTRFETTFNDGIAAFLPYGEHVFNEYFYWFLKSKTDWFRDYASRGQGQPNLNTNIIRELLFPIPPLEEQIRIVQRIEELFAICDRFKAQLVQREKVNERLVKGLVGEVLEKAGSSEEKEKVITVESTLPKLTKQELAFWQILIIAYTIKTLQKQQMLQGEMGLAKYVYLIDRIGGIETYFQFKQENFGPYPAIFKKRLYTKSKYFYKKGQKGFEVLDLTSKSNILFKKESERTTKVEKSMEEMAAIFQPYKKDRAAKLELMASVCWLIEKTRKTDFEIIWKELEDWETPKRDDVNNKAELFSEDEVMRCIDYIIENEWDKKLMI